jgi:hypothetical protein
MIQFNFHLSERTTRALMQDPLLPPDPTFADIRAALVRLDSKEAEAPTHNTYVPK